ncbi:hypothetical protein N9R81_06280 [Flavobacteriales bacterium]|nr:hypothetical protein [Flavobacteriales bacterium]
MKGIYQISLLLMMVTFFSCKKEKTIDVAPDLVGTWRVNEYYWFGCDTGYSCYPSYGYVTVAPNHQFAHSIEFKKRGGIIIRDAHGEVIERGKFTRIVKYHQDSISGNQTETLYYSDRKSSLKNKQQESRSWINYMKTIETMARDEKVSLIISLIGLPDEHIIFLGDVKRNIQNVYYNKI